jgi:cell division protein FtsB
MELIQVIIDKVYAYRHKIGTAGIGLFAVALAFHVIFGANGMLQYGNKRSEFQRTQVEVEQMQAENARLEQQIKALKTDPKTIEKEAREQLRYTRPGEFVYRLPNARAEMNTATASNKK